MDDAPFVRCLQRFGDLYRDRNGLFVRDGAARDPFRQGWPLDQLNHEGAHMDWLGTGGGEFLQAVDLCDVRVIQRGEQLGLALQASQPLRASREGVRQYLDRDVPIELGIASAIHLAHPACAKQGGHFVRSQAGTGFHGHRRLSGPDHTPGRVGFPGLVRH